MAKSKPKLQLVKCKVCNFTFEGEITKKSKCPSCGASVRYLVQR